MKIKNIILSLTVVLSIFATSCEDKLDILQHGSSSFDTFYQTDDEADEAITSVYTNVEKAHYYNYFVKNLLSDDFWSGGGNRGDINEFEQLNEFTFGPEHSYIQYLFEIYYNVIYSSNVVLGHVPDESIIQKRARAEAKVFRAFAYIDLISMWGTPPLVDHELLPSEYKQSNGDPAELWALVETDLKEAIESGALTEKDNAYDNNNYRVSLQFAQALLGKAYVFQEKWGDATTVLDKVVNSGKYALYDGNYGDLLTVHALNNCESMYEVNRLNDPNNPSPAFYGTYFAIYFDALKGWRGSNMNITSEVHDEGFGFCNPQSDLYNAFVQEEGSDGYRLNQTMKNYDAIKVGGDEIISGKELYGHEGIFMWKDRTVKDEMISGAWLASYNHKRYMRYAEVLLLAAEAHVKNGNVPKATEYVNTIRTRARLSSKSAVTMEDVMLEKRLELCGECVRFQDMLRWKIADKMVDQGKETPSFLSGGTVRWVEYNAGDKAGFKEKHWLLPFPEVEITLNENVTQNPGW